MTTIKRKKVENSEQESKIQKLGPGALGIRDAQVVREVDAVHDRVVVVLVGGGFARGG